jgi:hypothetical protein
MSNVSSMSNVMSNVSESVDNDQCPSCLGRYEIVALKFHIFRRASALMVCMNCGMVQSDLNDRTDVLPAQRSHRDGFDETRELGLDSIKA